MKNNNTSKLNQFLELIEPYIKTKNIVVFSGAGLSTTSGIKDFRGVNGLYKSNINAETILSHNYFKQNPASFYAFFRDNLLLEDKQPNLMHQIISAFEQEGIIIGNITQNIDGLDRLAGSSVIELHGNANEFYCQNCHKNYNIKDISFTEVPYCKCGGIIRPNIILYDEPLDTFLLQSAKEKIKNASCLLVLGSSLTVEPAAHLVHDFIIDKRMDKTKKLFIINYGETAYDYFADYKYDGDIMDIAHVLKKVKK